MFSAYEVGVTYQLLNKVSPGLAKIIKELRETGAEAGALKRQLDTLGMGSGAASSLRSATKSVDEASASFARGTAGMAGTAAEFVATVKAQTDAMAAAMGTNAASLATAAKTQTDALGNMSAAMIAGTGAANKALEFSAALDRAMLALPKPADLLRLPAPGSGPTIYQGPIPPAALGYEPRLGLPAPGSGPTIEMGPTGAGTYALGAPGTSLVPYNRPGLPAPLPGGGLGGAPPVPPSVAGAGGDGFGNFGIGAAVGRYLSHPLAKMGAAFGAYEIGKEVFGNAKKSENIDVNMSSLALSPDEIADSKKRYDAERAKGGLFGVDINEFRREILSLHTVFNDYKEAADLAPSFAQLGANMSVVRPGGKAFGEDEVFALAKIAERRGGSNDPHLLDSIAKDAAAADIVSQGKVDPQAVLRIIGIGGAAVAGLNTRGLFGFMSAIQNTMPNRTNAALGMMTGFMASDVGATPIAAIEEQIKMGIVDPTKVRHSKSGRPMPRSYSQGALRPEFNPFVGDPLQAFKNQFEALSKKGFMTPEAQALELAKMYPRTAASEWIDISRNMKAIERDENKFEQVRSTNFGPDDKMGKEVRETIAGSEKDLEAAFSNLTTVIGNDAKSGVVGSFRDLTAGINSLTEVFKGASSVADSLNRFGKIIGAISDPDHPSGMKENAERMQRYRDERDHPGNLDRAWKDPGLDQYHSTFGNARVQKEAYIEGGNGVERIVAALANILTAVQQGQHIVMDDRQFGRVVVAAVERAASGPRASTARFDGRMSLPPVGMRTQSA